MNSRFNRSAHSTYLWLLVIGSLSAGSAYGKGNGCEYLGYKENNPLSAIYNTTYQTGLTYFLTDVVEHATDKLPHVVTHHIKAKTLALGLGSAAANLITQGGFNPTETGVNLRAAAVDATLTVVGERALSKWVSTLPGIGKLFKKDEVNIPLVKAALGYLRYKCGAKEASHSTSGTR